jgi:hypothetical protein
MLMNVQRLVFQRSIGSRLLLTPRVITAMAAAAALSIGSVHAATLTGELLIGTKASNFNLTTMNGDVDSVIDWVVWGQGANTSLSPTNAKNGGTAISDLTALNPANQPLRGLGQFNLGQSYQWTDGAPSASASNVQTGLQINNNVAGADANTLIGSGFSMQVAGDASQIRTFYLWIGQHSGGSDFTATLSGASPLTFPISTPLNGDTYGLLKINFQPDSNTDQLLLSGTVTTPLINNDNRAFTNSYWFASAVGVVAVPEPSTYCMALAGLACGGYTMFRRRKRA